MTAACTSIDKVMSIKRAIQIGGLALGDCTVGTASRTDLRTDLRANVKKRMKTINFSIDFDRFLLVLCA